MGLVVDFGACYDEDDEEELVRAKGFGNLNSEIAFLRRPSLTQSEELSLRWVAKRFSLGLGIGFFFGFELLGGGWCDLVDRWWLWVVAVSCFGSGWFGFWV